MKIIVVFLGIIGLNHIWGQDEMAAENLLEKSLAHHDPKASWPSFSYRLFLEETRPGGEPMPVEMVLNLPDRIFQHDTKRNGKRIWRQVKQGECQASIDGRTELSEEEIKKNRLACDSIVRYHHYYLYLYGLPMKLKDPGTKIDPVAKAEVFQEQSVWAMRVTYDAAVGKDTWIFYFDRQRFALIGCRFYHDEAKNDGEYLVFEHEVAVGSKRLPQTRRWYTNAEGKFLGTDHLVRAEAQ